VDLLLTVNKNDAYKISNAARFGDFLSFGRSDSSSKYR
jgi:hypothetical protein